MDTLNSLKYGEQAFVEMRCAEVSTKKVGEPFIIQRDTIREMVGVIPISFSLNESVNSNASHGPACGTKNPW